MPTLCLLCYYKGTDPRYDTKDNALIHFIVAMMSVYLYDRTQNKKFILCDEHTAIYSQYFPCRNNKLRLSSNAINAILHSFSDGLFCTYTDPHGIMHIWDKSAPVLEYWTKIVLLEWGKPYVGIIQTYCILFDKQCKENTLNIINSIYKLNNSTNGKH